MLRVIGLGPGDPELVTMKAAKALRGADVVFVPKSTSSEASLARRIVDKYAGGQVVELEFKMGANAPEDYAKAAETVKRYEGEKAYVVLGDPALYSTFAKLLPHIGEPVEYIPGVSAIVSCSLKAGKPLAVGDEAVAIVPATRPELVETALSLFDTVVVVKANKNLGLLNRLLSSHAGAAVRRCYMEGETVSRAVEWSDYFTTVYLWRAR